MAATSREYVTSPESPTGPPTTRASECIERPNQYNLHQAPQQSQGPQLYHPNNANSKRFAKEAKQRLENIFAEEAQKPSTSRKQQLANELGCSILKVNNWFQNRRAREKQAHRVEAYKASQPANFEVSGAYGVDPLEDESEYAASSELYLGSDNDAGEIGEMGPDATRQQSNKAEAHFKGERAMEGKGSAIEKLLQFNEDGHHNVTQLDGTEPTVSDQGAPGGRSVMLPATTGNHTSPNREASNLTFDSDQSDDLEKLQSIKRAFDRLKRRNVFSGTSATGKTSGGDNGDLEGLLVGLDLLYQHPPPKLEKMDQPPPFGQVKDQEWLSSSSYPYTRMEVDSQPTLAPEGPSIAPDPSQDVEGDGDGTEGNEHIQDSMGSVKEPVLPRTTAKVAKGAIDEDRIRTDCDSCTDETMSVQSYAGSMFDAESVASSTSSANTDTQAFVEEYVDCLVEDPGLEKLFMRSMLSTELGAEHFRRKYSEILQSYASDLKRQSSSWSSARAKFLSSGLVFISRKSVTRRTASLIATRYMDKSSRAQADPDRAEDKGAKSFDIETKSDHDTSSSDETSTDDEPSHSLMITEMKVCLREGAPFQRMNCSLRKLVIPSAVMSCVRSSTERILNLLLGDEYLVSLLLEASRNQLAAQKDNHCDLESQIRSFGSKLKGEATSSDILRLAVFLDAYARYIGSRAVQRMQLMDAEVVLQRSQLHEVIAQKRCNISIEENPWFERPHIRMEHQQSPASVYYGENEDKKKLRVLRCASGFLHAVRNEYPYAVMKLGFTTKLISDLGLMRKDALKFFGRFPLTFSLVSVALVYLPWNELSRTITRWLWCWHTASGERKRPGSQPLRQIAMCEGSTEDGDGIEQNRSSDIWKPYKDLLPETPEEILEATIDENLPNLCGADIDFHWTRVASSKAFEEYVGRVLDMAIPTFFSEMKRLISQDDERDENLETKAGTTSLLRALEEVQLCFVETGVAPIITVSISHPSTESFGVSNIVKLAVEASSRSEWQWWPLKPPNSREKAKDTECRISWKCSCGTEREEIVPFVYASKLSHLASQFPLSNEPPERPPSSLSSASSHDTRANCGSGSQSTTSSSSSATSSSSLHGSTVGATPSSSVISFGTPPKAFVFLLVKTSNYTLAPIDVTEKKAREFFQAIVTTYNTNRGWWRRLLSIFVFSHCDFVKIKRYAPQSFDPGFRFSFPPHDESPHDKEYQYYYPRPMPHAPVSRHMFNHLYNTCYSDQGLAHKIRHVFATPSCIIKTIPGKLLDGIPKRDRLVDEDAEFSEDQDVEVFWGLVAREQRSALRVFVYMLLGLGPSLWFMFQWLFGWGHDGDLQGASVPLTFSATMLGVLLAVVYSGDDVREMEQPL